MAKVKIVGHPAITNPNEIYQQTGMKFAFLSASKDGRKQCHQFVLCRDFIQDVVKTYLAKNSCDIYDFVYNCDANPPIDVRRMRMLVTRTLAIGTKIELFGKKLMYSRALLRHYEDVAGWNKSMLTKVSNGNEEDNIWLFTSSSKWLKSPFLTSMYTFLIRLGDKELEFLSNDELESLYKGLVSWQQGSGKDDNDTRYLRTCWDKLFLVAKYNKDLFSNSIDNNYNIAKNLASVHGSGGIVSLCRFNGYDHTLNEKFKKIYDMERKNVQTKS